MRGRDARTPPATLSAGGMRWALRAYCRVAPAFFFKAGDGDPALASLLPRHPQPRHLLKSRGLIARPGRWVSGRESRHLPPVDAGAETPVVVQDAKVLVAGCKGSDIPLLDGSRESRSLPASRCNGEPLHSAGTGSMPVSASVRLTNPLATALPKSGPSLGISLGGPRGMGNPPARCGAVLPRTPCSVRLLNGAVPPYSIMEEER